MSSDFKVGDRVERVEDKETVGATILRIEDSGEICIEIAYDEGGGRKIL
jgi:hypothetical protein